MDKKNTMLLTVIAVATLLVAVVGATFAYFTVASNEASDTVVTGAVENVGTITLEGGSPLYLTVSAADMSYDNRGASYYTVSTPEALRTNDIAQVAKSTYTATLNGEVDGSTNTYTCNGTFAVTATGTMMAAADKDDVTLVVNDNGQESTYKLSEIEEKDLTVTWSGITGNGSSRYLSAYVTLKNTEVETGQNSLAGKNLVVTIKPESFVCSAN